MSKILITGGAGFIGSHLADKLIEKGHDVIVIDNLSSGKKENLNSKVKFYEIDVCDSNISQIFEQEKPEIIFHFAAQIDVRKSVEDPIYDAKVNVLGSLNLLQNCQKNGIKKFIFASSGGAIYGDTTIIPTPETCLENPESPYGICKLNIEKYLKFFQKSFGLNYTVLRFSNVYGPRQDSKGEAGVVAIFCNKMLKNEEVVINGDGKQTRDFVFVDDVVKVALLSIGQERSDIYNIGTGVETNMNEIFWKIKELTNSNCEEIHASEKLGEQKISCLDNSKTKKELTWEPECGLKEGLEKTIKWFKENEH
jgi:UDP-glucose 4-epimerase